MGRADRVALIAETDADPLFCPGGCIFDRDPSASGLSRLELKSHFSPAMASLIDLLALNNLYHSIWFRILLLLLCTNMIACTVDRLPKTVRLIRRFEDPFDSQKLSRFSLSSSISSALPREKVQSIVEKRCLRNFRPVVRS